MKTGSKTQWRLHMTVHVVQGRNHSYFAFGVMEIARGCYGNRMPLSLLGNLCVRLVSRDMRCISFLPGKDNPGWFRGYFWSQPWMYSRRFHLQHRIMCALCKITAQRKNYISRKYLHTNKITILIKYVHCWLFPVTDEKHLCWACFLEWHTNSLAYATH